VRGRSGPSDLRAHGMRLRGSEQDGANEARGTCRGEKKSSSAMQIRDLGTYLRLIVLCTINNEVDTRPVRGSVHRLESGERAEAGQAMKGRCRGNDGLTATTRPSTRGFPFFSLLLSSSFRSSCSSRREYARARRTNERAWS